MKIALFPGTFNPPTLGHLEIIQRGAALCDKLYIAIMDNQAKSGSSFSADERLALLKLATASLDNVEIKTFSGLAVDCAKDFHAFVIIRGLRNGSDFDYEYQMASTNFQMTGIETIFLSSSPKYNYLSSTLIREIASQGKRLHGFVPDMIEEAIFSRLSNKK